MRFSVLSTAVAALSLFSAPVLGGISSAKIIVNIKAVTELSATLKITAERVNIADPALFVIGRGNFPAIIRGFNGIVDAATMASNAMGDDSPMIRDPKVINNVLDVFRTFVKVHQALLEVLIGKAGLFNVVPFVGAPVAGVLRLVEAIVDKIAFGIIDLVDSSQASLQAGFIASFTAEKDALDGTLKTCQRSYLGLQIDLPDKRDVEMPTSLIPSASFRTLRI